MATPSAQYNGNTYSCYANLPQEIKLIILNMVFDGAMIMYGPLTSSPPRCKRVGSKISDIISSLRRRKLIAITSHCSILRANKQCWAEGIELFYQKAELTIQGPENSNSSGNIHFLNTLPEVGRKNIHNLSLVDLRPTNWLAAHPTLKLRDTLPALREIYLPTVHVRIHCPHPGWKVHDKLRDYYDLEGWDGAREDYAAQMPQFDGVMVFQEISLMVNRCTEKVNPISRKRLEVSVCLLLLN
jgi:hypothetical protein